MTQTAPPIEEALEALGFVRQGTIDEALNIPPERWDYRPHPEARSVAELVRHVLEATAMLIGEATDPDGDFLRRPPAEHVEAHAGDLPPDMSPAELRTALERLHEKAVHQVRTAGAALMESPIQRFDGGVWTRLAYVHHAGEHEAYHCGQLAMYARMMGLVPALTQRIHGEAAQ